MKMIAWLMLAAAILPFVSTILAKAGGKKFDNNDPRAWLARQEGWRARANAAQVNTFEALPFFFAAVLFALYNQAPPAHVATLMACWLGVRLGYLAMYLAGWGALRSLVWTISVGFIIAILFWASRAVRKRRIAACVAVALALVYAANADWTTPEPGAQPTLLAHRGVAQRYDTAGMQPDTCTATRMLPPIHGYLENTIASMRVSVDAGADIVEIDVNPTTDGQFAVFHDWTLDCRSDGHGVTREHSMAQLKALDIGYGYTADRGKTFPFRGQGVGLMPSLDEVLAAFPRQRFLINIKSRDPAEGQALARVLNAMTPERRRDFMAYGGDEPMARLRQLSPDVPTLTRSGLKSCLLRYAALGWTGHVPQACHGTLVMVPINVAPWLWGWPGRFQARLRDVGSPVFLIGPYHGDGFSTGIDTPDDRRRVPAGYAGGIWTNEIEAAAHAFKGRSPSASFP